MSDRLAKFNIESDVTVEVFHEPDPDWSWVEDFRKDDREKYMEKVSRGDIYQVCLVIRVCDPSGNVIGSDTLGGVVVGLDAHKQEIRDAIDDNDMIDLARKDLASKIERIRRGDK